MRLSLSVIFPILAMLMEKFYPLKLPRATNTLAYLTCRIYYSRKNIYEFISVTIYSFLPDSINGLRENLTGPVL